MKTIYIVEDNKAYSLILAQQLGEKYNVKTFLTAEDCLKEVIRRNIPNAILIDYNLPGINGLQLFKILNDSLKHTKLIMLSANDDGQLVLELIKEGVRDYIVKDDNAVDEVISIVG